MECPKCQSQNVVLCRIAYEQGTTEVTSRTSGTTYTQGVATGVGQFAGAATVSGQHRTEQTHRTKAQTGFAVRAAPPKNELWGALGFMGVLFVVVFIAVVILSYIDPPVWISLLSLGVMLALIIWAIVSVVREIRNLPKLRADRARWEDSWICAACGNVFLPPLTA